MKQRYGILLLEKKEIILRVYETDDEEWKLLYYQNKEIKNSKYNAQTEAGEIIEIIADLLLIEYTQHIIDWKVCSRCFSESVLLNISIATGLTTENLTTFREQELLCKGVLTELW